MKTSFMRLLAALAVLLLFLTAGVQAQAYRSTEIHPDGSVTFRYFAPNASTVALRLEGVEQPLVMTKVAAGLWSYTTSPLAPEIYSYHFEVDGQTALDPQSTNYVANALFHNNWLLLPGATAQPWEQSAVPHGVLHRHIYTSKVVGGLSEGQSEYFVYTPPGYDPKAKKPYPVLYLLHGFTDGAEAWTAVGRANLILDNLIAAGKATPMVMVMPLGYGEMSFLASGFASWESEAAIRGNIEGFRQALLTEVMPRVESEYRVSREARGRAIAGLSMGGLESLAVGLSHPETFGWVGGFSSALSRVSVQDYFGAIKATPQRRLLWIACGRDEELIDSNRDFIAWLKQRNIEATAVETPGMHTWMVWRDNLVHFAPLLFRQ
jgi:enterochelin esterase family protein